MSNRLIGLALGTFVGASLHPSVYAQSGLTLEPGVARLPIRPQAMATGTATVKGGLQSLEGLPNYYVYVPTSCVGTHRCPLVVALHGGGENARGELTTQQRFADQYRMILLVPNAISTGHWDVVDAIRTKQLYRADSIDADDPDVWIIRRFPNPDVQNINTAIQRVLRENAIDPDKIAVIGFSAGGVYALFLGQANPDIFSRVAGLSAPVLMRTIGPLPQRSATQFLLSAGVEEGSMVQQSLRFGNALRHEGHVVENVLGLRAHSDNLPDDAHVWHWLATSWGLPDIPAEPIGVDDSLPVLTTSIMTRMTTFWDRFQQEPDSVRITARLAHQHRIHVDIGQQRVTVILADIPVLAMQYPSIAADLQAAGLTAKQEERDRAAILGVELNRRANGTAGTPDQTSILAKNLAFREAHDAEFDELTMTGMWVTQ